MSLQAPFNRKRINQIYKAGSVNINGRRSRFDMQARADRFDQLSRPKQMGDLDPYFNAPTGEFAKTVAILEEGEIAFRNRDYTHMEMNSKINVSSPSMDTNIACDVMTTLNLLGERGRKIYDATRKQDVDVADYVLREEIASKLQIMGIVLADNRGNGETNVTLMIGGVVTLEHNGTHAIPAGHWIIAEVPSNSEVPRVKTGPSAGTGGRDYAEDQAGGRVTLRLEPYDTKRHELSAPAIYTCLLEYRKGADVAGNRYLKSFVDASLALRDGVLGIVLSGARTLIDRGLLRATDQLDNTYKSRDPTRPFTTKQKLRILLDSDNDIRNAIIDDVFISYRAGGHKLVRADDDYKRAGSGICKYMVGCAEHVRTVLERVIGRALGGAVPGTDIDVSLLQPSR